MTADRVECVRWKSMLIGRIQCGRTAVVIGEHGRPLCQRCFNIEERRLRRLAARRSAAR